MELKYLQDLWHDADTQGMDAPELLRYRSNLLGQDKRLTNYGGGNTSAKLPMPDPVTGETVDVLWVKGSGGDLGTIRRDGFATLYMTRLLALQTRYRGVEWEDEMPDLYPLCTYLGNPRAASIDTPLHAFLPYKHVDHLHPDWAIALAASANGPALTHRLRDETGLHLVWLPWKRPGFELGLWLQKAVRENPDAHAILLGSHGLFTWGDTDRSCYHNTLRVIDGIGQFLLPRIEEKGDLLFGGQDVAARDDRRDIAARLLPVLRGAVGPAIGSFDDSPDVLQFVNSRRAPVLAYQGTSCPDHFVRTKVRPLFLPLGPEEDSSALLLRLPDALARYRREYADYYHQNKQDNSPALRNSNPTVVLVPGVGLFSFGRSKAESRITGEFYINAIHVMAGATALQGAAPADANADSVAGARTVGAGGPQAGAGGPQAGAGGPQAGAEASPPGSAQTDPGQIVDNYVALTPREAFGIEYWLLEEAKLQRMPKEKELARKVALVVGAGPGIGTAVGERLAREGAHVVFADRTIALAQDAALSVQKAHGKETAVSTAGDITQADGIAKLLREGTFAYGGVDILVIVAAVFLAPDARTGRNGPEDWRATYEVNVLGAYQMAHAAYQVMMAQEEGRPKREDPREGTVSLPSIVLISSANAVVAKKGSLAYDTSKAALNHLVRELAVEYAPHVRVMGVAPASVVEGSQMFGRERVIASLAKYNIGFAERETTEQLRDKLAEFYARRTLLQIPVTPAAIGEAAYLAAGPRLGLTTGQVIPVDGGLPEAFLR